jgi:uncharacterized protein (UPF0335 family)
MTDTVSSAELKVLIDRIERVEEDMDGLKEDRKEIYTEAKDTGFDVKILRKVIRLRKQSRAAREEEQALISTYLEALGEINVR